MYRAIFAIVVVISVSSVGPVRASSDQPQGQSQETEAFERVMAETMAEHHLPGAGAVVVTKSGVAWARGFGYENREKGSPAQPDSVFDLMSISKVVTASALLALVEDDRISIDDEINPHLPFPVVNPSFPDRPITIRMLLKHTSSIHDDRETISSLYGPGDPTEWLEKMLRSYVTPSGELFKETNFLDAAPGDRYEYSNVAFALVGFLVERISGKPFPVFCSERLFRPVGMESAGWFLSDINRDRLVVRYVADADNPGKLSASKPFGWPGYPDGQLRASLLDVAEFLRMLLRSGEVGDHRVLDRGTVELMFAPQGLDNDQINARTLVPKDDLALPWQLVKLGERAVALHSGMGSGLASCAIVERSAGYAAALWISGSLQSREAFVELLESLQRVGLEVCPR